MAQKRAASDTILEDRLRQKRRRLEQSYNLTAIDPILNHKLVSYSPLNDILRYLRDNEETFRDTILGIVQIVYDRDVESTVSYIDHRDNLMSDEFVLTHLHENVEDLSFLVFNDDMILGWLIETRGIMARTSQDELGFSERIVDVVLNQVSDEADVAVFKYPYKITGYFTGQLVATIDRLMKVDMTTEYRTYVGRMLGGDGLMLNFAYRISDEMEYLNQEGIYMDLQVVPMSAAFDASVPEKTIHMWRGRIDAFNSDQGSIDTRIGTFIARAFTGLDPLISLYLVIPKGHCKYVVLLENGQTVKPNVIVMSLVYGLRARLLYDPEFGEPERVNVGDVIVHEFVPLFELGDNMFI